MVDNIEEWKRLIEEQIRAMIPYPSGPVYRSKGK